MREIKTIGVFGAGKMGTGIAQLFATSGMPVYLWAFDEKEKERAGQIVRDNLKPLQEHDVLGGQSIEEIVSRITITTDYDMVASKVDLAVECILEKMDLKQNFFKKLDSVTDTDVILCTNTSAMSVTEIFSTSEHKERLVGTHFWNPPYLIPLVEVVKTEATSDEAIDTVMKVMKAAGKEPCLCKKDVPGFIANRLQHALWREAISMVEKGIADPETIDKACRTSFGLRLPYLPPLENSDLVGTQLTYDIHSTVLKDLADNHEPSPILKQMIDEGKLGFRSEKKDGYHEGFMKYTDEEIADINNGLNEYLIKMLYNK